LEGNLELIKQLARPSLAKIIFLVIDGLGGLSDSVENKTELEMANTPNLDKLVSKGVCGLIDPVGPGITPGSAPGHLALFGYNPLTYNIGRGVLEATGIDFELKAEDVVARGNFGTIDNKGIVVDRRAGRISTEKCLELCRLLDRQSIDDVDLIVVPVKEHRCIVVFRGGNLSSAVSDSDPQQVGILPKTISALDQKAENTAAVANKFLVRAQEILSDHYPANMILLRGFSRQPCLPTMSDIYRLKPAAISGYPMYRGLARLVGMKILETGASFEDELTTLRDNYTNHDFFFIHVKATDAAGEDGDFMSKVEIIEQVDDALTSLLDLEPDVIVVTGDHSTPAVLKGHSWHPVPILLSAKWCRADRVSRFSEVDCASGSLGRFPAVQVMTLAMANAFKLAKFGA
jgi:2,3-bisphosphoglycerate-independent phosphoglycerate mutase